MKSDFTRQTFRPDKHYSRVLMQQGRVQLDADWNEQQAIHQRRDEQASADVIGATGVPKALPGFQITAQGNDLLISEGHFYLDGILCENEADLLFSAQDDLLAINGDVFAAERPDTELGAVAPGLYVAYLEVWERHITSLQDDEIREKALGGPDTTARSKTVWQVRLLRVADPGGPLACDTNFPEWNQLLDDNLITGNVGQMRAQSQAAIPSPDPLCVLPTGAGYRRLANQLYRVEVHQGGDRTQARFKWSRDNGTVVSAIEPDQNGVVVQGNVIAVAEMGKDDLLTFASEPLPEWLELSDDRYDLLHQHGTLAQVQAVDPATRLITLVPGTLPVLDPARHPIVRRWDQRGATATGTGVAMTGNWQQLEDGVEVLFEDGTYRVGDYWLIPARTAIGLDTGNVEWPQDGGNPAALSPHGQRHHFARLALLRFNAGNFSVVPNTDCRPIFPPLTAITAEDVSFDDATCQLDSATNVQQALDILCQRNGSICTLLVGPGEDLATAIHRIDGEQHAMICLRAGTYVLNQTLRIQNRGHIQIMGAGPGTRVVAATAEAAFYFTNCASVRVSNLHVECGVAGRGNQSTTDLNGALTFLNCLSVTVEGASVQCAGGPLRAASCITIRHAQPASDSQGHVHGCDLAVGHLQVGVLVVNVDRSHISDNRLRGAGRPQDDVLLQDSIYRGLLRSNLINNAVLGGNPPSGTNATVTFNGQVVHFRTDPGLIRSNRHDTEWQAAITTINPAGIGTPAQLNRFLRRLASDMLRTRGNRAGGTAAFVNVINALLVQDVVTADQGIVIGGRLATDVQIVNNQIRNAIQGIHVALGINNQPASAGVVVMRDNTVRVALPTTAMRDRYGIFVASCASLVIESNYIDLIRVPRTNSLRCEGMRLFGTMGRRVIVRHNHMGPQFAVGITFAPLNSPVPTQPLWIISENVMESSPNKVDVPQKASGQPGVTNPATVRARTRGINDNFA